MRDSQRSRSATGRLALLLRGDSASPASLVGHLSCSPRTWASFAGGIRAGRVSASRCISYFRLVSRSLFHRPMERRTKAGWVTREGNALRFRSGKKKKKAGQSLRFPSGRLVPRIRCGVRVALTVLNCGRLQNRNDTWPAARGSEGRFSPQEGCCVLAGRASVS